LKKSERRRKKVKREIFPQNLFFPPLFFFFPTGLSPSMAPLSRGLWISPCEKKKKKNKKKKQTKN